MSDLPPHPTNAAKKRPFPGFGRTLRAPGSKPPVQKSLARYWDDSLHSRRIGIAQGKKVTTIYNSNNISDVSTHVNWRRLHRGPVHRDGGLLALLVEARDAHLLQPLLDHLVNEAVVSDKATLVLGRVLSEERVISKHSYRAWS